MIGQNTNKLAQGEANKLSGDKEGVKKSQDAHTDVRHTCTHTENP